MSMKPNEQTLSIIEDLADLDEGEWRMFDISEYRVVKKVIQCARLKDGKCSIPLWDRDYTLRAIRKMGLTFAGRLPREGE